jgi:Spy/CpxP family protein refolding chaperone
MKQFYSRILTLGVAAFALVPVAVMAQQGQGQSDTGVQQPQQQHRMGRHARMHRQQALAKKLNLTDQQKQQFQQINQTFRQQAKAIHNDSSLSDADKKQKLQELRKQSVQQRMAVLTPEQQQKLKEMREERRKEKGQGKVEDKTSQNKEDDNDLFAGMTGDDAGSSPLL